MVRAVIFDMDGVLVDSEPQQIQSEIDTLARYGLSLEAESLRGFTGVDNVLFFQYIQSTFGLRVSTEELIRIKNVILAEDLKRHTPPVAGLEVMKAEIEELVELRALASSSYRVIVDTVIQQLGLQGWFGATVAGDEVPTAKPDPAIFLKAAHMLGVEPWECLVLEDSTSGIQSALEAGMRAAGYMNPKSGNQDLSRAEVIIDSLTDFPAVVRNLCR